jgi:hypothetical protein
LQALLDAQMTPHSPQFAGSALAVSEQLPPQQKPVVPSEARQAALSGAPAQPAQVAAATQAPAQQDPWAPARRQSVPSGAPVQAEIKQMVVPVSHPKPLGQVHVPLTVWQRPVTQVIVGGQALPANPQLSGSVWKLVQPVAPQLPKPPSSSTQMSPAAAPVQLADAQVSPYQL